MTGSDVRRFVLLRHEGFGGAHWDLMLEAGERLATWRLPGRANPGDDGVVPAERIGDHRRDYLDYEGPVRGDRGHVRQSDMGTCRVLAESAEAWSVEFFGARLRGRYQLSPNSPGSSSWSLRRLREDGPSDSMRK